MTQLPRPFRWSLAAVAVLALVGGCSDDDDGGAADDGAPSTTVPAESPSTDPTSTDPAGTDAPGSTTVPVETATAGSTPEPAVEIVEFAFDPTPVTVTAGSTVTWTNQHEVAHTTTAEDGAWDSDPLEPGTSFEQTFDEPGTYDYHCAIHNFMTGQVVVS